MPIQKAINQKYGTSEGRSTADGGLYCAGGPVQVLEWDITLTDLTETESVMNDVLIVPDNSLLEKVEVVTLVGATTGAAIDVGLLHISRATDDSEFTADPDGILAAFVTANMDTVGQTYLYFGSGTANTENSLPASDTLGGDLIGDVITAPCFLTASRTTSTAFGAGRILIRLYLRPSALSD